MRRALLITLILSGCAHPDTYMRPAAGKAAACDADAYVVFVRPGRGGSDVEVREADGTLLGQLGNSTWFGTSVAPGEHLFVARSDKQKTHPVALKADLGPGRTYYVDVELVKGFAVLFAVAPRVSYWKELGGWLASAERLEIDPAKGRAAVPEDWPATYSYALEWWDLLDEKSVPERKLIVADGTLEPTVVADLTAATCAARPAKPAQPVAVALAVRPADDKDVPICRWVKPVGTTMWTQVCKTDRAADAEREAAWQFMELPRSR